MITKDNIEAYLLDFVEGNLSNKDKVELILFLKKNPEYKELMEAYDSSLILVPDKSIVFSNTELLKPKPRKRMFFVAFKYSAMAIAACVLVFLFVSKLVINPVENKNTNQMKDVLVAKQSKESVIQEENKRIEDKNTPIEKVVRSEKVPKKSIAKNTQTLLEENIIEQEPIKTNEPKIILTNSLVVYKVDNIVRIIQPKEEKPSFQNIIEVDNMIVYKDNEDIKKNNLIDKLKQNIESRIDKGFQSFNSSLAYFQENIRLDEGGITLHRIK